VGEHDAFDSCSGLFGAAVVLAVVALLPGAAYAGGNAAQPGALTGSMTVGVNGAAVTDGTCPVTNDTGTPLEELRQYWAASIVHRNRVEFLGIKMCWTVTGALGGDFVDFGHFEMSTHGGTISGNVSGTVGFEANDNFDFVLHVRHGTNRFHDLEGDLTFSGCTPDWFNGGRLIAAKISAGDTGYDMDPRCFPPT
jgi:hypothetical protein